MNRQPAQTEFSQPTIRIQPVMKKQHWSFYPIIRENREKSIEGRGPFWKNADSKDFKWKKLHAR